MNGRPWLTHPLVVGAVAVLAVNDHMLKPRWPNLITGKLSDVAGLFLLTVAVAALVGGADRRGRAVAAVATTGTAFALLKLVPPAATLAAPFLGGTTATDPTDLLALPILYPAYHLVRSWRTHHQHTDRSRRASHDDHAVRSQRTNDGIDAARVLAATLAVTAGTFSITATSCLEAETLTGFALTPDGIVAAIGEPHGGAERTRLLLSTDGGRTWGPYAPAPPADTTPVLVNQTEICINDASCYRVVDNDRVEQRTDNGQWQTAFAFTPEQRRRMELRADSCSGQGDPDNMFAFLTPTGPTSPADPNPPTVVVSMATQGILRLDPDTGRWDRIAVGPAEPLSLRGPSWLADLSKLPLLFLLITPALYLVNRRRRRRRQRLVLAAVATGVALAIGLATLGVVIVTFGSVDYATFGTAVAAISVAAFVVSLGVALRPPRAR